MKRFIVPLLATVLGFFFLNIAAGQAASFSDVAADSEFYAAVEYLKSRGVISGYVDGTFKADRTINRAEALAVVLRMLESMKTMPPLPSPLPATDFSDVKETDWFGPFISQASALKLIEGYSDNTFRPANNINVAESLKIILLAASVPLPSLPLAEDPFVDVGRSFWHAHYVLYTREKQLLKPRDDGKFHAERDISRGDFALLIYRLMYLQENKLDVFPLNKDWPIFRHPTDHFQLQYPFGWQKFTQGNQSLFWKPDTEYQQLSFVQLYPNSATIVAVLDRNETGLTLEQYVETRVRYSFAPAPSFDRRGDYPLARIKIPGTKNEDFYLMLPDKQVLVIFTQSGDGLLQPYLQHEIEALVSSVRHDPGQSAEQKEAFLSTIRESILVQGKGKAVLERFSDLKLVETDTIGLGTGPVDYYYSEQYDVTLKYERTSQTLLGLKTGKTTTF